MQKPDFEDRRIFERIPTKLSLRFLEQPTNREGLAQTQDISAKGVGLLAKDELFPHTPVEMWLQIPNKDTPVYLRGEVVWSRPAESENYRVGVNLDRAELMGMSAVLRTAKSKII